MEYGKAKADEGLPIFNYSVAYGAANRESLFYEMYPGSINDVSQLTCMIDRAHGYGYRNLGFILDRGYFSRKNLSYMEQNGYNFLIMVKGMKEFISDIILENHGKFENSRAKYNDRYDVYGTTIKQYLYEGDQKKRNIHIYYSDGRAMGKSRRSSKKYSIFWKCVLCVVRKLRVSKKNNEHYIDRNTPGKNKNPRSIFTCFYLKAPSKIISANLTFRSLTAPDNSNIPLVLSVTIKVKVFS